MKRSEQRHGGPPGWRCWRFWYQGPPGARGLYVYRDNRWRGPFVRRHDSCFLAGVGHYHAVWYWRWGG